MWACYSIYADYNITYHQNINNIINNNINIAVSNIKLDNMMLYNEFWYILIFFNWPKLSPENTEKIKQLLKDFNDKYLVSSNDNIFKTNILKSLIDFIEESNDENNHYFFNWKIDIYESLNHAITYRTLQRTLFQRYKGIHGLEIFGSIN